MEEYTLDGQKYYFTGKSWTDDCGLVVPTCTRDRLNPLLMQSKDMSNMTSRELYDFAKKIKQGENYHLAIKALELLIERDDQCYIQIALPMLTSAYRKTGAYLKAISVGEQCLSKHSHTVESNQLYTSLGAAYCDHGNCDKGKECADKAWLISGRKSNIELMNLYSRINKMMGE